MKVAYKQLVLPESKSPYHFNTMDGAIVIEAHNPICGDHYQLFVKKSMTKVNVSFHGFGCALSKASTSILLKEVEGKTKSEAIDICHAFIQSFSTKQDSTLCSEQLKALIALKDFDARLDCILLSWKALLARLQNSK